ncbi:MAG: biopolymer transporter ExbD, partial [Bdellovibrionota bacterium]
MAGYNPNGDDYSPIAEMNMIPLVDVMLVLLIISMVTAPFLEQGVNVELPVASGQNLQKSAAQEPVVLFLARDKNLRLGDTPVSRSDLVRALKAKFQGRHEKELFVRADKDVPYG